MTKSKPKAKRASTSESKPKPKPVTVARLYGEDAVVQVIDRDNPPSKRQERDLRLF